MSISPGRLLSLLVALFTLAVGSWAHADNDRDNGRGNSDKRAGFTVPVTGTGFEGTFTIDRFARTTENGVAAVGVLKGVLTSSTGAKATVVTDVAWPVVHGNAPVILSGLPSSPKPEGGPVAVGLLKVHNTAPVNMMQVQATCNILNLVLGPLDLNLLGLRVQLNQVVLNITGVTGAGNLLGNLLCAITGILNNPLPGLGQLITLVGLLNQLLGILAGL